MWLMKVESWQPSVREVALPVGVGLGPGVKVASGIWVLTTMNPVVLVGAIWKVSVGATVLLGLGVTVMVALGAARAASVNCAESVSAAAV